MGAAQKGVYVRVCMCGCGERERAKPLVVEMPGKCPLCEGRILKKTSRRGYTYYGCEKNSEKDEKLHCDFMTWDVPVKENCTVCDKTLFKKSGRGAKKPFCINESCENFLPEEKRGGYRKKTTETKEGEVNLSIADGAEPPVEEKKTATKKSTKKSETKTKSASKTTTKTKSAEKKTTEKKTAEKKTTTKAKTTKKKATTKEES